MNKNTKNNGIKSNSGRRRNPEKIKVKIQHGESLNGNGHKQKKEHQVEASSILPPSLRELLTHCPTVDFRERMGIEEDRKPKQKHYVVLIIEEVLEVARRMTLGLAVQNDFIYVFNGAHWVSLDKNIMKMFLGKAAKEMGYIELECKHYTFREELCRQFLAVAYFPPPEPSNEVTLINLQNGTLEVTPSGYKLREHRREDFLTYVLPFHHDPDTDCPIFLEYLKKVQPDLDAQKLLAEFIGYVFTRHLKLEKLMLLYGTGANGKSVFFDILNALLGKENISNYSLANLNEEHNRAQIVDKLLNYGSEIRGKIDIDILKQMASGEPIQARLKYGNSFNTDRYAKLAFNCNQLPPEVEHNEAYFRRFIILPFDVTIPKEEQNPNLAKEIIANELPGVLNWVLIALERLLNKQKFSDCKKSKEALNQYRLESDSVALFLDEENYESCPDARRSLNGLFQEYRTYCHDNNYRCVSNRNFRKRLEANGCRCKRISAGWTVQVSKKVF